jgi:hypothetical protein
MPVPALAGKGRSGRLTSYINGGKVLCQEGAKAYLWAALDRLGAEIVFRWGSDRWIRDRAQMGQRATQADTK